MGSTLSKSTLFPVQLSNEMISLVRGKSSLARLSASEPIPFNGVEMFTFNFDNEVNLVGENGAKANGGGSIEPVTMSPVKVEYGMRISDEFRFAAEEVRLQYLRAFAEGFAKKVARGLDIMAFHGVNPRTGSTAAVLTNKNFDDLVTNEVPYVAATPDANVDAAIALVEAAEHEVTGMAMAPAFKSALANMKAGSTSNQPLFPELGWGSTAGSLRGLPVDTNSTVSANSNNDRAIVGNFADYFRWGYSRNIAVEMIEYGNPDNSDDGDLKGHNQVYLRGEAYVGWGILVPAAFARIEAQ